MYCQRMPGKGIVRDDMQLLSGAAGYNELLEGIRKRIATTGARIHLAANRELVLLYWSIGRDILARQEREGWGAKVIDQLARDLKSEGHRGFSRSNLHYMRAFAVAWPDTNGSGFVQQPVAQIPWGHNIILLERLDSNDDRRWYAERTLENGWSRNVLQLQIKSGLHLRQGKAPTNFETTLPAPESDLVRELIKDPYDFSFLSPEGGALEADIEKGLISDVESFLLELGQGFALVGRQYKLEIGGDEFFLDLLLYHPKLHRYIVIDLKVGAFKAEYSGKMNLYLNAVDDLVATEADGKTLGLILCTDRNEQVVEYALRGLTAPIAVPSYRTGDTELTENLPVELQEQLPSVPELEAGLQRIASQRIAD